MLTATATAYLLKPSACSLIRSRRLPTGISVVRRNTKSHRRKSFANHYAPCREVWQRGEKVNRYIGYDAGEVKRYEHSRKYNEADKKYHNRYPLIEEWGWNRDDVSGKSKRQDCRSRVNRPVSFVRA